MFILCCKNNHQTFYSKYKKPIIFSCIIIFLFVANLIKGFIKKINEQEQRKAIEEYARQIIKKTQQTNEKIEEINKEISDLREGTERIKNSILEKEKEIEILRRERLEIDEESIEMKWYIENKRKPNHLRKTAPNSPKAIEAQYRKKS